MALEEFRTKFGSLVNELIGTAILVFTIQLAYTTGVAVNAALTVGIALAAIVYAGGPISGAHYNPAITLSVLLRGKITAHESLFYWLFQLIGGFLGALLGRIISGSSVMAKVGSGHNVFQAWLAELIFTAILCYVVLATATSSKAEGNSYYGLAIGFVVFVGASTVGPISGGAFNPAVVIGLGAVKHFWRLISIGYALWIIIAELLGAALGAFAFYITAPDEFKNFGENIGDLREEARSILPRGQGTGNA